jgi:PAS domain S-box-containing protein
MRLAFAQFFEAWRDAMLVASLSGKISQANAAAESLFGYGRGQLQGQPVKRLFPGQSLELWTARAGPEAEAEAEAVTGWYVELVGRRADLSQFPAQVQIIPVTTGQGQAAFVSIRDITEQQRAQFVLGLGLDVLHAADRDRAALLGHLIRAQEDERGRIAAGIHDDTLQVLTAASLLLDKLRLRLHEPGQLQLLQQVDQTLRLSMGRLRQLIFDLRPAVTDDRSLTAALGAVLEQIRADTGIAYQLEDCRAAQAPADANMVTYRTAREALVNVAKHAHATTVWVQLLDIGHGLLVKITDDGVGYSPAQAEDHCGHLGLILMRERVQTAGGWCRIESTPGAGATVKFWVPLAKTIRAARKSDGRAAQKSTVRS